MEGSKSNVTNFITLNINVIRNRSNNYWESFWDKYGFKIKSNDHFGQYTFIFDLEFRNKIGNDSLTKLILAFQKEEVFARLETPENNNHRNYKLILELNNDSKRKAGSLTKILIQQLISLKIH